MILIFLTQNTSIWCWNTIKIITVVNSMRYVSHQCINNTEKDLGETEKNHRGLIRRGKTLPAIGAKRVNTVKLEDQREPSLLSFVLFCHICSFQSTRPTTHKKKIKTRIFAQTKKTKVSILIAKSTWIKQYTTMIVEIKVTIIVNNR